MTTKPTALVLAVAGQKGGVGKTTTAVEVALELHQRGRRVLLVDADPQGSLRTFADVAAEAGEKVPEVVSMGADLFNRLPALLADIKAAVLITRKAERTSLGQGARDALADCGLPVLGAELGYRVAFQEAPALGRGVTAYAPSSAAATEVRALVDEIEQLTGLAR